MMKKHIFDKYKQLYEKSSLTAKNANEPINQKKIIIPKIPLKYEQNENQKKCTYGRMNSAIIKNNENPPSNISNNNNKNTINVNKNFSKKISASIHIKSNNMNSKTARINQSNDEVPKIIITSSNKKKENISKLNKTAINDSNVSKKSLNTKNDPPKTIETSNIKYDKIPQYKRRQSTINEYTFNRLRDLQSLIKKESALKELCKLI